MIFVYNFLQIILLIITLPILLLVIFFKKKYRGRMLQRLGFGLHKLLRNHPAAGQKVIWVHALSVGEVTSAIPLLKGLRLEMDDITVVFSASTKTGVAVAERNIRPFADFIISAPLDLLFSVNRFIQYIRPDLFILIETDFWPNWLNRLNKYKVPMMLANGRISKQSFTTYHRFRFFFTPMFSSFSLLSMQTDHDAAQLSQLGVADEKIAPLGNLKYDTAPVADDDKATMQKSDLMLPDDCIIWLCGSTHRGEEEIILAAFSQVKKVYEKLVLIIAPRDPGRTSEIADLADTMKLVAERRTTQGNPDASILILDTIGELTRCYKLAKIAFIGGSLVPFGGHNPLEAAVYGVPVLFGPHMDDFQEIAFDCMQYNAGIEVHSVEEITVTLHQLLQDDAMHARMSKSAVKLIRDKSGVVSRHVSKIRKLLAETEPAKSRE